MTEDITVLLSCYKRPHSLKDQYNSIKNQTVSVKEVMIWQNKGELNSFIPLNREVAAECSTAISNKNFGVWSRFAYALNADTEYVCIFDDDTIPGDMWLENCLNTIKTHNGLLGTIGVIFKDLDYQNYDRFGWANPNEKTEEVDIVGHSWFFRKEWLSAFWQECGSPLHHLSGEDVHFSYSLQKYFGLKTYVPPHPKNNKRLWGSLPESAYALGVDNVAVSVNCHGSHFGANLKHYKNKGFKYILGI
jgi:glycosyltransferase involved in cell wall biosynthesis